MNLNIQSRSPEQSVIQVAGRLDAETSGALKQAIKDIAAAGVKFVTVEMSGVTFIDSSGLSALVSALKTLRQNGGMLNLAAVTAQAQTALRLTMLDRVLPIFPGVEDAVSLFPG